MKKRMMVVAASVSLIMGAAQASGKAHWGYSGHAGPEHWGSLDAGYSTCSAGKNQSPVDLNRFVEGELQAITFDYHEGGTEVVNNGHTIQVNYTAGSTITVDGQEFELKQFHFHAPSENLIKGRSFPMEAHFVHADADGNLAVVAVMLEEGAENEALAAAWAQMPGEAGASNALKERVLADALLPKNRDHYRFTGSLTTPPCSEGVRWLVMKTPMTASKEQIEAFRHVMHHHNNRPVQPLNARVVVM